MAEALSGERPAPSPANPILTDPRSIRLILGLAWPVIASMGLQSLFILVDLFWVGRLGAGAVAAVSTSIFVSWTLLSLGEMISVGVLSVAARRVGAGRRVEAAAMAWQGFFWGMVLAVLIAAAGLLGAPALYRAVTEDPEVRAQGVAYLRIFCAGAPVLFVALIFQDLFRGVGDTATPFRVLLATLGLNAVLDPLLIFGPGPFPAWGTAGAATATVVSYAAGTALYLGVARGGTRPLPMGAGRAGFRPSVAEARRIVGVGLPITFVGMVFSIVYLVLGRIAAGFGTGVLAALGIGNRVEAFSYLTAHGLGVATAALVGQNLGAGQVKRAERLAARAVHVGSAVAAVCSVVFLALPEPILRLFTSDPRAVSEGVTFLRVLALCQIIQAWELVLQGGFAGSGHTLPPMMVSVPLSVIRVPLAWLLSGPAGWGPAGIWWTLTLTALGRGLLLRFWWGRGTWKRGGPAEAGEAAQGGGAVADPGAPST